MFTACFHTQAYNVWAAKHGEEQFLPGLPYTPRQLFFINFGQVGA